MKIEKEHLPVFVYGTLKFGYNNFPFIMGSIPLGKGITKNKYSLYVNGLPYLKKNPNHKVKGEVYEINPIRMTQLDLLEGHPDVYKREKIEVVIEKKVLTCWAYFYTGYCKEKYLTKGEYIQLLKNKLWR